MGRCAKCWGRGDGAMCTDCAAAYIATAREHCQWDHAVLMMALDLKVKDVLIGVAYDVLLEYPDNSWNFLVGEVMRQTKGYHEPWVVKRELRLLQGETT
jgi:hypothetical protein